MKAQRADGGDSFAYSALLYCFFLCFTFCFSFVVRFLATAPVNRSIKLSDTTDSYLLLVVRVAIIDFYSSFNVSAVILTELIAFESIAYRPLDIPSVSLSSFTSFALLFVFFLLTLLPELDCSYFCCGVFHPCVSFALTHGCAAFICYAG